MSEVIECRAVRRGRLWVAHEPEHGVYGSGRTLRLVRESVEGGLAAVGVTAEVTITAVTPELEKLRAVEEARTAALIEAVKALALRKATLRDIAEATGVPAAHVKRLLAANKTAPAPAANSTEGSASETAEDPEECHHNERTTS
ncbi:hypothetical protein [Streptomyces sp. NPDC088915]|uniref:hypothetical protein n=1 Tax=Streptomyces sp. NPDC088915 TaxID=3365912 RepID=UPI00381E9D55